MIDRYLRGDIENMASAAYEAESRPHCAYYQGTGICSFGCWEEPTCRTGEPSDGWHGHAATLWADLAKWSREVAREERGHHTTVKYLRDLVRYADRQAQREAAR